VVEMRGIDYFALIFIRIWTIPSSGLGYYLTISRWEAFMESTDIAYIAGIIDGEGTITLSKLNKDDT
jgi:hypothetical protein